MPGLSVRDIRFLPRWARLAIAIPAIATVVAAFWIAAQFLHPIPPRRIVLAAGPAGGALHLAAEHFRERLAKDGVTVEVRTTPGVGANAALLRDAPASGVDLAFVLAGAVAADAAARVVNVANLAHVAVWGLARERDAVTTLAELRGKRVAVGMPGSGLEAIIAPLLAANGVDAKNTRIVQLPDADALAMLAAGELDVVFSPEGAHSPAFVAAAARPEFAIVDFVTAEAYARRFPHLAALTLPMGTVDLANNVPARQVTLIGTTLMLAARADLHPTVVDLLVDASRQVPGQSAYFGRRGEFPNHVRVDEIPVSEDAVRYARTGPSFLRRYLPLWLADFLQRVITLAIPLFAVVLPLARLLPGLINTLITNRLDRCYEALRRLEADSMSGARPAAAILRDVDELAAQARSMQLPMSYTDAQFGLRRNIDHVRGALRPDH